MFVLKLVHYKKLTTGKLWLQSLVRESYFDSTGTAKFSWNYFILRYSNSKLDLGWKISRLVNISNKESEFSASFLESYFIVRTLEYYRYTIFQ